MMKRNIGTPDRLFRLAIAVVLLGLAWSQQSWIVLGASLFTFYEALAGWCIMYALLGKSSCPLPSPSPSTASPSSPEKDPSRYAIINGQEIYYEVHGEGEPLLLIEGFTCNCLVWSVLTREFASRYKLILFDNRGAGRSSCPDIEYTVEDMAKDTVGLMDFLKISKAHILGHSMGGAIAQAIAYRYPDRVNKLILSCTSAHFSKKSVCTQRFILYLMEQGISREVQINYILPWVYSNHLLEDEQAVANVKYVLMNEPYKQSPIGFVRQFKALEMFDSRGFLGDIKAPTLVINGTEDLLCLTDHKELLKGIDGSEEYQFEGVGHLPHIEEPKRFIAVVTNFL